jgi:hypothetical protein
MTVGREAAHAACEDVHEAEEGGDEARSRLHLLSFPWIVIFLLRLRLVDRGGREAHGGRCPAGAQEGAAQDRGVSGRHDERRQQVAGVVVGSGGGEDVIRSRSAGGAREWASWERKTIAAPASIGKSMGGKKSSREQTATLKTERREQ